jgi:hypothetical protein
MTRTTVYTQNLIGTQGYMVDKKQIKSNESIQKINLFWYIGGLDPRIPSFHSTIFTTAPRIPLLPQRKFEKIKSI